MKRKIMPKKIEKLHINKVYIYKDVITANFKIGKKNKRNWAHLTPLNTPMVTEYRACSGHASIA